MHARFPGYALASLACFGFALDGCTNEVANGAGAGVGGGSAGGAAGSGGSGGEGTGTGGTGGTASDAGPILASSWLRTDGNRILNADGTPFHGRGANIFDTRQCGACAWAPPHPKEVMRRIDELVDVWHANFMRFDLTSFASNTENGIQLEQWGNVLEDQAYLADLQAIMAHVGTKPGVYVILTLFDDPSFDANELPTDATIPIWTKLGETFVDSPHVLYGITNEPHGTTDEAVWQAMNKTVEAIRATEPAGGPHHLIAVQGTQSWARELGYYVTHPIAAGGGANVVYETHAYDDKALFAERFIEPSKSIPVVIGEFGPAGTEMTMDDCKVLMEQAEQAGVPYIGWSFSPQCAPYMLESGDDCGEGMPLRPTEWGTLLKDRLANAW